MKVDLFAMPTVPATLEERERLRPVGRNTQRYQMMLEELRALCKIADELGVDAFSTTEHHFHTEGNELSVNPILLFADFAARTQRIKMWPMSIVMSCANPIRVAAMMLVSHWFENREPTGSGVAAMPWTVHELLAPYRAMTI